MPQRFASAAGSFRLAAAFVTVLAVTIVFQHPQTGALPDNTEPVDDLAREAGRVWSVRTDGWVLEVDGAQVPLPRVEDRVARQAPSFAPRPVRLSPFDHIVKRHAAAYQFDWHLIAAIIFEESRFEPNSRSPKGAFGLMQVREIAAEHVGEYRFKLPEDNIRTGVRYLAHLGEVFADVPQRVRQQFVLAGYNGGPAHVRDAQTLARRLGFDPDRWEGGVRETLPLLEEKRYYGSVPNGYAQGRNIVRYVESVLHRFRHYQRMTAAATLEELAAITAERTGD